MGLGDLHLPDPDRTTLRVDPGFLSGPEAVPCPTLGSPENTAAEIQHQVKIALDTALPALKDSLEEEISANLLAKLRVEIDDTASPFWSRAERLIASQLSNNDSPLWQMIESRLVHALTAPSDGNNPSPLGTQVEARINSAISSHIPRVLTLERLASLTHCFLESSLGPDSLVFQCSAAVTTAHNFETIIESMVEARVSAMMEARVLSQLRPLTESMVEAHLNLLSAANGRLTETVRQMVTMVSDDSVRREVENCLLSMEDPACPLHPIVGDIISDSVQEACTPELLTPIMNDNMRARLAEASITCEWVTAAHNTLHKHRETLHENGTKFVHAVESAQHKAVTTIQASTVRADRIIQGACNATKKHFDELWDSTRTNLNEATTDAVHTITATHEAAETALDGCADELWEQLTSHGNAIHHDLPLDAGTTPAILDNTTRETLTSDVLTALIGEENQSNPNFNCLIQELRRQLAPTMRPDAALEKGSVLEKVTAALVTSPCSQEATKLVSLIARQLATCLVSQLLNPEIAPLRESICALTDDPTQQMADDIARILTEDIHAPTSSKYVRELIDGIVTATASRLNTSGSLSTQHLTLLYKRVNSVHHLAH